MKKVLLAALFVGVLAVTGAYADSTGTHTNDGAGVAHACGPCNQASGSTNGCIGDAAVAIVGGNAETGQGCVCVGGGTCASHDGAGNLDLDGTACFANADGGCTADHSAL